VLFSFYHLVLEELDRQCTIYVDDLWRFTMNKEHLMNNGKLFAYETSKYFASPERLLRQYTCKDEVVVLSTKRLYVYFFNGFIDVKDDLLKNVSVTETEFGYDVVVRGKVFPLVFDTLEEKKSFIDYYNEFCIEE
jgi:hypothetical protein